jgi:hypothetical protein
LEVPLAQPDMVTALVEPDHCGCFSVPHSSGTVGAILDLWATVMVLTDEQKAGST